MVGRCHLTHVAENTASTTHLNRVRKALAWVTDHVKPGRLTMTHVTADLPDRISGYGTAVPLSADAGPQIS